MIDGGFNFWRLLEDDFHGSFQGKVAFENCLTFNIFEKLLSSTSHQKLGFFLLENQAWEKALIYNWQRCEHGLIIGVQHAAMARSDLRFYQHPSEYNGPEKDETPNPRIFWSKWEGGVGNNDKLWVSSRTNS